MKFYQDLLGLELGEYEKERKAAFFWIGKRGEAMLGIWESSGKIEPQHFAFRCSVENVLNHSTEYLEQRGLDHYNFLATPSREPMVFAWMPAISIYFKDPDGHELEFIAMLPHDPEPELGVVTFEAWMRRKSG